MTIELELRLEGKDANEGTLSDLKSWIKQDNIDGVEIKRKELPPAKGDMGGLCDLSTIITMTSGLIALADIAVIIASWQRFNDVTVIPTLKNLDTVLQENEEEIQKNDIKIQELLAKIEGKTHRD